MKRIVHGFMCAAMMGLGVTPALSQGITISASDAGAMFASGTTTTYRGDTLTTTAIIGAPGATSWDFSTLNTHTGMTLQSLEPSGTPYFTSHFPAATHALRDTAFTYSFYFEGLGATIILKGAGYNYMTLGTDLLDYGFKGAGNAYIAPYPNAYPAEGQWVKTPPAVYYSLPLALSKTWTTTYNEILSGTATIFGAPIGVGPDTTRHTIVYTVDAYGPLTVPGAGAQDALRIRKVDTYAKSTKGVWAADAVRVGYMILAKNGASVQFSAVDPNAPTDGTIAVTSVQWTTATPTSVQAVSNVPGAFTLSQNYPNPFNPSTTIRFTLPSSQQVTLRVYNLLGAEVATLVNQTVEAGESSVRFDGAGLPSGMYLYKLQAGAMTQTRRMMLVK